MSYKSNWANGGWLVICDACGRKFKESELRKRWDGLMVCRGDWEVRQPQDYVRGVADIQAPPYVRPEQRDRFLPFNFTQYPSEAIDLDESVRKGFTKDIGNRNIGTLGALNGDVLNGHYLGYSDTGSNPEQILISEVFLAILGRSVSDTVAVSEATTKSITKTISDTVSVSETIALVEVEQYIESLSLSEAVTTRMNFVKSISETVSVAEAVSRVLVSSSSLNGSALNSSALD